ncbi:MAG: DNA/RNA non-specific endonuclease [Marinilabiliaceae bacterium]|nr:DNA/RNA non-specific endonuclease [Marinilabiliaceae bacterium]
MKRCFFDTIFFLLLLLSACSNDNGEFASLKAEVDMSAVPAEGMVCSVDVNANGTWLLSSNQSWVSLSQKSGKGSESVEIVVDANPTTLQRMALILLECGAIKSQIIVTQKPGKGSVNVTIADGDWLKRIEVPALKYGNIARPLLSYEESLADSVLSFVVEWDPEKRHSRWVAFSFNDYTAQKNWSRSSWTKTEWGGDPFQEDTFLPEACRTTLADYKGSNADGYDRGHLCASADRLYSQKGNEFTFYLSNISPQLSVFNQGVWESLESYVQGLGRNTAFRDTLYVVKGGTIEDDCIQGWYRGMPVPSYYFMALLCQKKDTYKALGILMEHTTGYSEPYSYASNCVTIDELEALTGIDFFCNLDDEIEKDVESHYDISQWNGLK